MGMAVELLALRNDSTFVIGFVAGAPIVADVGGIRVVESTIVGVGTIGLVEA